MNGNDAVTVRDNICTILLQRWMFLLGFNEGEGRCSSLLNKRWRLLFLVFPFSCKVNTNEEVGFDL